MKKATRIQVRQAYARQAVLALKPRRYPKAFYGTGRIRLPEKVLQEALEFAFAAGCHHMTRRMQDTLNQP